MKLATLSLLAVALVSLGHAEGVRAENAAGTYVLQFSEEARASFRLAGTPEPTVRLRLGKDFSFEVDRVVGARSYKGGGHYKIRRDTLVLLFDGESPLGPDRIEGEFDGRDLNLEGFNFVRERERERERVRERQRPRDWERESAPEPLREVAPAVEIPGTWTVRRNGAEDRSIRLSFSDEGTFEFKMSGASSRGKYHVEGGYLVLLWTEVDGDPVELGTMRKRILLEEDGSFKIDTFRYAKSR